MRFHSQVKLGLAILWLVGCQNSSLPPTPPQEAEVISTPQPQSSQEVPALGDQTMVNQAPVSIDQAGRQDPKSLHYRPYPAIDGWAEDNPDTAGADSPAQPAESAAPSDTDTGSPDFESLLKEAREAKEKAFTHYTRLVTVGDEPGDVEQALKEYRNAVQRLEQLQQSRGPQ